MAQIEKPALAAFEAMKLIPFEALAVPVYVHDSHSRMVGANSFACAQSGYSLEELQSLHLRDLAVGLTPAEIDDIVHRVVTQAALTHRGLLKRKDGSTQKVEARTRRWVQDDGQTLFVCLMEDLSNDSIQEARLTTYEQLLRECFEFAPLAQAMLDERGRVVRANPAFCRLLGYREAELIGQPYSELIHPDDLALGVRMIDALSCNNASEFLSTLRYIHRHGQALAVKEHISVWNLPAIPFRAMLMAWPVTDHSPETTPLPSEPEVRNSWTAVRTITEKVLNELSQPLNSLSMFSAASLLVLKNGGVSQDKLLRCLEGLSDQVWRAERIASQLEEFLRVDDDPGLAFSFDVVMERLLLLCRQRELLRKVKVHWIAPQTPMRLTGSSSTLEAVLLGLMEEVVLAYSSELQSLELHLSIESEPKTGYALVGMDLPVAHAGTNHSRLDESAVWVICRTAIETTGGKLGHLVADGVRVQFSWPQPVL